MGTIRSISSGFLTWETIHTDSLNKPLGVAEDGGPECKIDAESGYIHKALQMGDF